jgi:hypothetical protein
MPFKDETLPEKVQPFIIGAAEDEEEITPAESPVKMQWENTGAELAPETVMVRLLPENVQFEKAG